MFLRLRFAFLFFNFLFSYLVVNLWAAVVVPAGESIQAHFESHPDEVLFILEAGEYSGNIVIDRALELRGQNSIIQSSGRGTTVRITAPGTVLYSLIVDGSGGRYDQKDAAVAVNADGVRVENVTITGATFGIVVELVKGVKLIGNTVWGDPDIPFGLRGDGIRIWETESSLIMSNQLINSRDLVVWYASGNTFKYNQIMNGRYGVHFMYSHYNRLAHNQFISNVVGSFIMYSRHLVAHYNLFAGTSGPSGYGMGIKESGNLSIVSNAFVNNVVSIYSDNAPYDSREENIFAYNLIASSEWGIEFHGQPKRNIFRNNTLKKNRIQVRVSGQATAEHVTWLENHYDDYRGYDMNHDEVGDIPYQYRRLMNDLSEKNPTLMYFDGTPIYYLINLLGEALPLIQPRIIMSDPRPKMNAYPNPFIR